MTTAKKVTTYYLPLAAVLVTATAVVAVPFQQAFAQAEEAEFLIRIVQGTAQTGLVNVSVQIDSVVVSDLIDVEENNVAIQIPITANLNIGALVCATILSSDDQVCRFVQNVDQENRVTLNLNQAQ